MEIKTECRCLTRHAHVRVVCDDEVHMGNVPLVTFQRDDHAPRWQDVMRNQRVDVTAFDADGKAVAARLDATGARVNLRCTSRCGKPLTLRSDRLIPVLERVVDGSRHLEDPELAAAGLHFLHIELTVRELRSVI